MEIVKTKNGIRYKERIYVEGGARICKTFKRKTDAMLWKSQMLVKRENGQLKEDHLPMDMNYTSLFNEFIRLQIEPRGSEKTLSDYRSVGRCHLIPLFGAKMLSQITSSDGDRLLRWLRERNLRSKTANKIITLFKQTISFANKKRLLRHHPLTELKNVRPDPRKILFLTDRQVVQLLRSNVHEECYGLLLLAVNTGMRIGELCGLCWDRVNFESNHIEVTRTMSRTTLKETTKTHRVRYIPMNPEVQECLRSLWRHQTGPKFVFTNQLGQPFNPDHYSFRHFRKALNRAGLASIRFHDLRHTFASQFMMKGGSLYDLQKILGHSKIEQTTQYAHLAREHLQKAATVVRFSAGGDRSGVSPFSAPDDSIRVVSFPGGDPGGEI